MLHTIVWQVWTGPLQGVFSMITLHKKAEETQTWLIKARYNLGDAGLELMAEPPVTQDFLSHCQMAVEEAMEALRTWNDEGSSAPDASRPLAAASGDFDTMVGGLLKDPSVVRGCHALFQDADECSAMSHDEAKRCYNLANDVYSAVIEKVPDAVRPGFDPAPRGI